MDSKVVLITGASSGMGEQTALLLAKKGFIVYAGTRNTKNINTNNLQNLIPLKLDITDPSNIKEAINTIIKNHKKIDILINNAGYGLVSTVEDLDEKEMFDQYNINVFGLLRVCKETIPFMRIQNSGIIINISSFLGKIGLPLLTLYNSSKYAVEGITDSLRYELSEFNIRVHSIMPGFFNTDFAKKNLVTNFDTFDKNSPYSKTVSKLAPVIVEQINQGNHPKEVAFIIKEIIENDNFPARVTIGEKLRSFYL